ncbi:MAG: bifunctional UDP-sugar hydrolase/5'-nucleotidase UshA [Neisseria animaloris]|nr:bifunctional UDP-sugar hydrolase/5'-nucleotidase UshA [Neisseria animaloris]
MKHTLLMALLLPALAHAYQPGKTYSLTVLHTNDLHGRFWQNAQGEYGLPAHQTLVKQIKREVRKAGGSVIVLSAGDINTGVPESDIQNARPDIAGMNAIGYTAMALGNHEFDNPLQILDMQEKWAKFPFLSANARWKKNGKPLVKPYVILRKNGLKIAIVGLTTEDTATIGNPEYTTEVVFEPSQKAAEAVLKEVDARKPDIKIALTHLGYYHDGKHGYNAPGDVSLARGLPKQSFHMIIGGHSHTAVCLDEAGRLKEPYKPGDDCRPDYQNGTWIMQAGEWGKYLGRADFEFKDGKLTLKSYRMIPVNLKYEVKTADGKTEYKLYQNKIAQDKILAYRLGKYQEQGDKLLGVKVGSVNSKLEGDRSLARHQQTNLGRLIAHAQRERTRADLAIVNSGGIRDSIPAGDVTYKSILKTQPFGNIVSYVDLTGSELKSYLKVVGLKQRGSGGYPQFDNVGLSVNYKNEQVGDIRVGGQPVDDSKTYRLSISSYLASGGDGYPKVSDHPKYVNTGFVDAEILKQYFEKHSPLDAAKFMPQGEFKVLAD